MTRENHEREAISLAILHTAYPLGTAAEAAATRANVTAQVERLERTAPNLLAGVRRVIDGHADAVAAAFVVVAAVCIAELLNAGVVDLEGFASPAGDGHEQA